MPTLNWIGKDAVVKHHQDVPFRLLEPVPELSHGSAEEQNGNLIVQGDNLDALKALLPRYAGKVKCIYIDPPYNTGNEGWVYNDNVNSPEIRRWLDQVVGKEGEDLSRHDKWLCMMYPRLVLLRQFLCDDGAIFVSIDDNEVANLRLLMNEIFGETNFITNVCWFKRVSPANDAKHFSSDTETLTIYAKDKRAFTVGKLKRNEDQLKNYKNPDNDPRGVWNSATYTCNKSATERPNLYYPIIHPESGDEVWPSKTAVWKFNYETYEKHRSDSRLYWGASGNAKKPRIKKFLSEMGDVTPRSIWHYDDSGHTQEARTQVLNIIENNSFVTPKPTRLIERVLQVAKTENALILDSFAGSGTTAHAVLKQNANDGGKRNFILVEMDSHIAENVTAERVRRVCSGYTTPKGKAVEGLGGGFQYCRLSAEPLFDASGAIRDDVRFAQLAEFVWFAETGTGYSGQADSPLLGVHEGRAVYLLYNGILKDRTPQGGNVLTQGVLADLPDHDGPKVIYAAACRLGAPRLQREQIVFKQTPYALEL